MEHSLITFPYSCYFWPSPSLILFISDRVLVGLVGHFRGKPFDTKVNTYLQPKAFQSVHIEPKGKHLPNVHRNTHLPHHAPKRLSCWLASSYNLCPSKLPSRIPHRWRSTDDWGAKGTIRSAQFDFREAECLGDSSSAPYNDYYPISDSEQRNRNPGL